MQVTCSWLSIFGSKFEMNNYIKYQIKHVYFKMLVQKMLWKEITRNVILLKIFRNTQNPERFSFKNKCILLLFTLSSVKRNTLNGRPKWL